MKKTIMLLILLLILPAISAINIKIEKQSSNEVLIADLNKPAVFDMKITNLGADDSFEFYNLLGFQMSPVGTTPIKSGKTENIKLAVSPIGEFKHKGFYTFNYYIRGNDGSEIIKELTFKSINLEDAFELSAGEVNPEENSAKIYLQNRANIAFENLNMKITSALFNFEESFSLSPNEKKDFSIQLNKEDIKKLTAGFYTLKAEITAEGVKANIEKSIKFVEKNLLTISKEEYGLIIHTQIIIKTNEGNVVESSETLIQKNLISRLFTSFSPEPDIVERNGFTVDYTWVGKINPGETFQIKVKTNWLFPLIIIFFIIAIIILAKQYSGTDLVMRKKVSFMRAKGGEFALKVTIFAHAKKYLERVSIVDRLPALTKIYEKFSSEKPTRIDEKNRRIEWVFEKLEAGETRVLSYVLYSKIGVVGKFALPPATAIYEKEGRIKESESNKAFFVSEQKKEREEEY